MGERSRALPAASRTRRSIAAIAAALVVVSLGVRPGASAEAPARFLTLPFASAADVHIQRAWWAQNRSVYHHAVDYIRGTLDAPGTWERLEVLAAAPGDACAQLAGKRGCIEIPDERLTNRVLVRHEVDGTVYFTVYADLATIAPSIPVGSTGQTVHLERGAPVGVVGEDPELIHLHFEVLDADRQPVDPYGIEGHRSAYPDPSASGPITAPPGSLWSEYPPRPPAAAVVPTPVASAALGPPSGTPPTSAASASPVASALVDPTSASASPVASASAVASASPAETSVGRGLEPGPETESQVQRLAVALAVMVGVVLLLRAIRGQPGR